VWRLIASGHVAASAGAAGSAASSLAASVAHVLHVAWAPLLVFAVGAAGGLAIHYARQRRRHSGRRRIAKRTESADE